MSDEIMKAIQRSGARLSWCGYCDQLCLAGKRSLCCGDAVYDDNLKLAEILEATRG